MLPKKNMATPKLKMLPVSEYVGVNRDDPIRFYHLPVIGSLYRQRVELCLGQLTGGGRILEIGFGSGVTFFNLHDQYREIYGLDLTASVNEVSEFFGKRGIETVLKNGNILGLPYEDGIFDSVLLISILEHLQPADQDQAFKEIARVLKPGGQVVYGVPVERPLMVFFFHLLGYDIHKHHFSTEKDVIRAASQNLSTKRLVNMPGPFGLFGGIYQVGHFVKS
jgi:ubiquinone/menaquinone biosynthesis C-methylase UbiE